MSDAPKFYVQWNFVNWTTIVLMAFIGMAVIGAGASLARTYSKNQGASSDD